jgi:hypothetical protein
MIVADSSSFQKRRQNLHPMWWAYDSDSHFYMQHELTSIISDRYRSADSEWIGGQVASVKVILIRFLVLESGRPLQSNKDTVTVSQLSGIHSSPEPLMKIMNTAWPFTVLLPVLRGRPGAIWWASVNYLRSHFSPKNNIRWFLWSKNAPDLQCVPFTLPLMCAAVQCRAFSRLLPAETVSKRQAA